MITAYAQVDTRQSPSGKLVLRTRRYEIDGRVYNIIKHFLNDGHYELSAGLTNCKSIWVEGDLEWGIGLTWKQAERKVEERISRLQIIIEKYS